ncbi:MAG: c-type cytochrome [Ardenticatenales bacterium]|nr:c-type cytochrome [Ardenticatenales bacterium]
MTKHVTAGRHEAATRIGLRRAAVVAVVWMAGLAACTAPTAEHGVRRALPTVTTAGAPVPAYAADPAAGARRYGEHCTACHGADGAGDGPLSAGLQPPPPDWTADDALQHRSPAVLFQAIRRGVLGSSMKRFDHLLDPPATWDVVFHVWQLRVEPEMLRRGARDYARDCAACHGTAGVPDATARTPSLVRPDWVRLTRSQLVDLLVRSHPESSARTAGTTDRGSDVAAIAEHLWSFLTTAPESSDPSAGVP